MNKKIDLEAMEELPVFTGNKHNGKQKERERKYVCKSKRIKRGKQN